jgi:hypothetical protein
MMQGDDDEEEEEEEDDDEEPGTAYLAADAPTLDDDPEVSGPMLCCMIQALITSFDQRRSINFVRSGC